MTTMTRVTAAEVEQARDMVADARARFEEFRDAFAGAKRALAATSPGFHVRLDAYVSSDLSWVGGNTLDGWLDEMAAALEPQPEEVPW